MQVVVEQPGELIPRTFWLLTSMPSGRCPAGISWRCTGTGPSLRRLAERVLRTPARFTVSGRRITMITGGASAH